MTTRQKLVNLVEIIIRRCIFIDAHVKVCIFCNIFTIKLLYHIVVTEERKKKEKRRRFERAGEV